MSLIEDGVKWANEEVRNPNSEYDYDYCILKDVFGEDFKKENFKLVPPDTKRQGYKYSFNGCQNKDPDKYSKVLYMLAARKFNERLCLCWKLKDKIQKFEVCVVNGSYRLKAEIPEGENIILGGDWALNWNLISEVCEDKRWDVINKVHTLKWHPLWPSRKRGWNTVNQVRSDKKTMKETLNILEECFGLWNSSEKKGLEKGLKKAFDVYKDWYLLFDNFNCYCCFWDLDFFKEEEITKKILENMRKNS